MNIQDLNGCEYNDYVWYDVSNHEDVYNERHTIWVSPGGWTTKNVYIQFLLKNRVNGEIYLRF